MPFFTVLRTVRKSHKSAMRKQVYLVQNFILYLLKKSLARFDYSIVRYGLKTKNAYSFQLLHCDRFCPNFDHRSLDTYAQLSRDIAAMNIPYRDLLVVKILKLLATSALARLGEN